MGCAIVPPLAPDFEAVQAERKRLATLQAVAALQRGIRVDPIESDGGRRAYIVSRWSLTRQCDTLDEVGALLRRMGVALE
jgi:hypothetical protein